MLSCVTHALKKKIIINELFENIVEKNFKRIFQTNLSYLIFEKKILLRFLEKKTLEYCLNYPKDLIELN